MMDIINTIYCNQEEIVTRIPQSVSLTVIYVPRYLTATALVTNVPTTFYPHKVRHNSLTNNYTSVNSNDHEPLHVPPP